MKERKLFTWSTPSVDLKSKPVHALSVNKISTPAGIFDNAVRITTSGLSESNPVKMISPLNKPLHESAGDDDGGDCTGVGVVG